MCCVCSRHCRCTLVHYKSRRSPQRLRLRHPLSSALMAAMSRQSTLPFQRSSSVVTAASSHSAPPAGSARRSACAGSSASSAISLDEEKEEEEDEEAAVLEVVSHDAAATQVMPKQNKLQADMDVLMELFGAPAAASAPAAPAASDSSAAAAAAAGSAACAASSSPVAAASTAASSPAPPAAAPAGLSASHIRRSYGAHKHNLEATIETLSKRHKGADHAASHAASAAAAAATSPASATAVVAAAAASPSVASASAAASSFASKAGHHSGRLRMDGVKGDLFTSPASSSLAHCVSECLAMGKGIAPLFKNKFGGVAELKGL